MARLATSVRASNRAAVDRLRAQLDGLSQAKIERAARRAFVSVRRKAPPVAKRVVRETYNVDASALSGAFDATQGSDGTGTFVALRASVAPVSLIRFGGRWRRNSPGATAEILRGGRKVYTSAFITTLRNGSRHIMARKLLPSGQRTPRLPLQRLHGPSAYQMVQGRGDANARRIAGELSEFAISETMRQILLARKERG